SLVSLHYLTTSRSFRPRTPPSPTLFPYTTLFRSDGLYLPGTNYLIITNVYNFLDPDFEAMLGIPNMPQHSLPRMLAFEGTHGPRSEEHTSELQSRENLVCRLLLEKKKTNDTR